MAHHDFGHREGFGSHGRSGHERPAADGPTTPAGFGPQEHVEFLVSRHLDGDLSPAEVAALFRHLANDADVRYSSDAYGRLDVLLRQVRDEAGIRLPEALASIDFDALATSVALRTHGGVTTGVPITEDAELAVAARPRSLGRFPRSVSVPAHSGPIWAWDSIRRVADPTAPWRICAAAWHARSRVASVAAVAVVGLFGALSWQVSLDGPSAVSSMVRSRTSSVTVAPLSPPSALGASHGVGASEAGSVRVLVATIPAEPRAAVTVAVIGDVSGAAEAPTLLPETTSTASRVARTSSIDDLLLANASRPEVTGTQFTRPSRVIVAATGRPTRTELF